MQLIRLLKELCVVIAQLIFLIIILIWIFSMLADIIKDVKKLVI